MKWLEPFGRFWWDFVVGDDWLVAVLVAVAIGATAAPRGCGRRGVVAAAARRPARAVALAAPGDTLGLSSGGPVAQLVRAADS